MIPFCNAFSCHEFGLKISMIHYQFRLPGQKLVLDLRHSCPGQGLQEQLCIDVKEGVNGWQACAGDSRDSSTHPRDLIRLGSRVRGSQSDPPVESSLSGEQLRYA